MMKLRHTKEMVPFLGHPVGTIGERCDVGDDDDYAVQSHSRTPIWYQSKAHV